MTHSFLERPRAVAVVLFLALVLAFLGTLTADYAFDGVAYTGFVEVALAGRGFEHLFQANHLLHGPLAYGFALATGGIASEVAVHVRLQVMEALIGAATIALLFLLLDRLVGGITALAASLGVAFTHVFWHFSTDVEVYALAALLLVFALSRALAAAGGSAAQAAWAGAAAGLAALGHIAHGVFGLVTVVFLVWAARRGSRLRTFVVFDAAASAVLLVGLAPLVLGPTSMVGAGSRLDFLLGYARPGALGVHLDTPWARLGLNTGTALHAFLPGAPALLHLALVLVGVSALVLAGLGWRRADPRRRNALILAVGWSLAHLVFFLMWDPNSKYWIASMVPGAVILALGLEELGTRIRPVLHRVALLALPLVLLAWNLPRIIEATDPARNMPFQIARAIREATPEDAVILISGVVPHVHLKIYIPYFGERRALVVDFYLRGEDSQARLERLRETIASRDRPYFALSELLDSEEAQRELTARHDLPQGSLALLGTGFQAEARLPGSLTRYRLPLETHPAVRPDSPPGT